MIDVKPSNQKVSARILRILAEASGKSLSAAEHALRQAGHNMRAALVMLELGVNAQGAKKKLRTAKGGVREALGE
jgi:N-acetylmuramic acid 6-phosphate etherase